jgi:putative MFS transporter
VRASAVGITTGMSRIGAAVGTFMVPFALRDWGIGPTMLTAAIATAVGLVVCIFMAEETRNMSLADASQESSTETTTTQPDPVPAHL